MKLKSTIVFMVCLCYAFISNAQVNVDINVNMKHSVNGVSDFGRDRHMLVHSALTEPDWEGEEEKMEYLLEDLDTYLGRDNGSATWYFQQTPGAADGSQVPDYDEMDIRGAYWRTEHENLADYRLQYESRSTEMIMGTNPHPTYPTLCWNVNGFTTVDPIWQPKYIQTSADWVVEYLDKYFAKSQAEDGKQLPKYWEVINEPDMLYMTGQFMVTSQEKLWEYHNLVAEGVKARLGNNAPLIGGMTWGLHDLPNPDGLSRFAPNNYDQWITDPDAAAFYREAAATDYYDNRNASWYQWDIQWKGFIDAAGSNMDFYSIHIYDWPTWETTGGAIRAGGHTEAMLDMVEWYDIQKFGTRKPVVISEYGAVSGYQGNATAAADPDRRDWENLKPFSQMLLQFLERPDYLVKTLPFTPIKATWGDWGDTPADRYPYTMMDDHDGDGNWEWSEFIKFFELWSDVKGTRVDTKTTDLDIMADCYVDGDVAYVILSNLELVDKTINLNVHGENGNSLQNVRIKHLYLSGDKPTLSDNTQNSAPGTVTLGAEATMILAYDYSSNITINQTSNEKKYYGNSLSGTVPNRVRLADAPLTAHVNGVSVPSTGEAMLRIGGNFYWTHITTQDSRNVVTINGHNLEFNNDWRGEQQGNRNNFFGVLEVEVPIEYLSANNTITCQFLNVCEYTQVNLQVWDMSTEPGRTIDIDPDVKAVTGVSVSPTSTSVKVGQIVELFETISPDGASNQMVNWTSSNNSIATVDGSGKVSGVAVGNATITVTTVDGGFTASSQVAVEAAVPTGITISPSSASMVVDLTKQLTATVVPTNAQDKSVTWSSNNTSVASVSSSGLVTANASGSATITARTNTGGLTATCNLTVENPPAAVGSPIVLEAENFYSTGGTFNDGSVPYGVNAAADHINTINSGDYVEYIINASQAGQYEIEYMISTPSDDAQIQFKLDGVVVSTDNVSNNGDWEAWTSLKAANFANISSGVHTITIVASGTNEWQWNLDKLTLTMGGSPTAVTGVSVSPSSKQILVGEDTQLSAIISPSGATDQSVTWSSSNSSIASVNANGVVNGVAVGTASITARTNDGGYTSSSSISVVGSITNLVIEAEAFDRTGAATTTADACGAVGFNATATSVNCVNAGEWAEYDITVSDAGVYEIEYMISTPLDGSVIEMQIDNASVSTDNVVNNGGWDSYVPLVASNTVELSSGSHTVKLVPGANEWQWNLDKFSLTKVGDIDGEDKNVTGVSLSQTSLSIVDGNTATLIATVSPSDATNKTVSWSSNNTSIATVSNGVVTAQSAGNATITVTTADGGFTATCAVTVTDADVKVTGVSLSQTSLSLVDGTTATLTATVSPSDATNKTVSWSSNNSSVATVSNGVVTAQSAGNATITVTTADGGFTATCAVTVTDADVKVTGVSVSPTSVTLTSAGATRDLAETISPSDATNKSVSWNSSNNNVATVNNNGLVTAVANGTATITVTTVDGGFTANSTVIVNIESGGCDVPYTNAGLSITQETVNWTSGSLDISCASSVDVSMTIEGAGPMEASDYLNVYYSIDGGSQVAISELTNAFSSQEIAANGLSGSTLEIIVSGATSYSDETYTVSNISVSDNGSVDVSVTGVSVSPNTLTLNVGQTSDLTETVSPSDATNKSVSWTSSNTSIASVNSNGLVTAIAAGNATITVTSTDGGYTATCAVQVNAITSSDPVVSFTEPTTTSFAAPANVSVAVNATDDGSISNVKLYLNTTLVRQENTAPYQWNAPTENSDGILQALAAGTYTLRAVATDNDGNTGEASMTITVGEDNTDPDTDPDTNPDDVAMITVEAESFTATSGKYDESQWGGPGLGANKTASTINWVNSGDYMDYTVDIAVAGAYEVVYYISSPNDGSTISIGAPSPVLNTSTVPNNGEWDSYQAFTASSNINLSAGGQTIRLTAGGPTWTWNLDKFTLEYKGALQSSQAGNINQTSIFAEQSLDVLAYPNPANDVINIDIANELQENSQLILYSNTGNRVLSKPITSNMESINVSDLQSGMYILKVVNGNAVNTKTIIKK